MRIRSVLEVHLVFTPFDRKPFLARCGSRSFFITDRELTDPDLEESKLEVKLNARFPGKRWLRRTNAHFCAGEFFAVEADGLCRACRKGGACRTVKVRALEVPEPKRKRPEAPILSVEENLFIEQFIEQLSPEEIKTFRTFSAGEVELFRKLCSPIDETFDDVWGHDTPSYKLPTVEEQELQVESCEFDGTVELPPDLQYLRSDQAPSMGATISRRKTFSAEQQRRNVKSGFDYIRDERERKRLGVSAQEWWNRKLRGIFEKHRT